MVGGRVAMVGATGQLGADLVRSLNNRAVELPWRVCRPLRLSLASEMLRRTGFDPLSGWRETVRKFLRERETDAASVH